MVYTHWIERCSFSHIPLNSTTEAQLFTKRLSSNGPVPNSGLVVTFTIWKTIKLGTGLVTGSDFRTAILKSNRYRITPNAHGMLEHPDFTVAAAQVEVDLVKVPLAKLGYRQGGALGYFFDKAQKAGLEYCPSEVGPQLRLQYRTQPQSEDLRVAMKPFMVDGHPLIFTVQQNSSFFWLATDTGYEGAILGADHEFIFVQPRVPQSRAA
jgi:hypothetical protein